MSSDTSIDCLREASLLFSAINRIPGLEDRLTDVLNTIENDSKFVKVIIDAALPIENSRKKRAILKSILLSVRVESIVIRKVEPDIETMTAVNQSLRTCENLKEFVLIGLKTKTCDKLVMMSVRSSVVQLLHFKDCEVSIKARNELEKAKIKGSSQLQKPAATVPTPDSESSQLPTCKTTAPLALSAATDLLKGDGPQQRRVLYYVQKILDAHGQVEGSYEQGTLTIIVNNGVVSIKNGAAPEISTHEDDAAKEEPPSARPVVLDPDSHLNERTRLLLVNWIVRVHSNYLPSGEILYLTVNLIDRYLERKEVSGLKLHQLVGVTSLLIACKHEGVKWVNADDMVKYCGDGNSRQEIIEMEEDILKTLEYQITVQTSYTFYAKFCWAALIDTTHVVKKKIEDVSRYILDGTLQSYGLNIYLPKKLAAAAIFIARRHVIGQDSWSPLLVRETKFSVEQIAPVARAVLEDKKAISAQLKQDCAVTKKYAGAEYGCVAKFDLVCDF